MFGAVYPFISFLIIKEIKVPEFFYIFQKVFRLKGDPYAKLQSEIRSEKVERIKCLELT